MTYQRSIHLRSKLRSVLECCYKKTAFYLIKKTVIVRGSTSIYSFGLFRKPDVFALWLVSPHTTAKTVSAPLSIIYV